MVRLQLAKAEDATRGSAAEQIKPYLAPGALVLTLQNGVDNDQRAAAVLGAENHPVAPAVVYVATAMGVQSSTEKGSDQLSY